MGVGGSDLYLEQADLSALYQATTCRQLRKQRSRGVERNAEGVRKLQPRATPWGKDQFRFLNSEGVREERGICKDSLLDAVSLCLGLISRTLSEFAES